VTTFLCLHSWPQPLLSGKAYYQTQEPVSLYKPQQGKNKLPQKLRVKTVFDLNLEVIIDYQTK
jgi:hypothetical protein